MARSSCLIALLILGSAFCPAAIHPQAAQQNEREQARKQLQIIADYLAGQRQGEPSIQWPNVTPKQLMEYLKQLSKGDELRLEAIALARKYASPADLIRKKPDYDSGYHRLAHARLRFAWRVLMETGLLREGLNLEEAVAILGPLGSVYGNKDREHTVDWYYSSPMHVNPCLRCYFKDGRVEKITVVNR